MNTLVSLPILAAMPVAAPSIAGDLSPDQSLIELGKLFDEQVARFNHFLNLNLDGATQADIQARDDGVLDAFSADDIFYEIGRAKAATLDGYLVKARAVAMANRDAWEKPFDDLDWGPKNLRMMVESIFDAAGEITAKQYLRSSEVALATLDPIFAAIDAHRQADTAWSAAIDGIRDNENVSDEIWDRRDVAAERVISTKPTTPAGLAALTTWTRARIDWMRTLGSSDYHDEIYAMVAAIDDATRGMSGLKAWSPVEGDAKIVDGQLLDFGRKFEDLLAIEVPLENESHRLHDAADRLRYEKMGIDPDDEEACRAASSGRWTEWKDTWPIAAKELGYYEAYDKWNRASRKTARIGKKILKLKPATTEGLLIQARVIDQHDEIGNCERDEQLLQLITDFSEQRRVGS